MTTDPQPQPPQLEYARTEGLRRQWWSRRAAAALFVAIIALPSPVLLDFAMDRLDLGRRDYRREIMSPGVFFGCSGLALALAIAARWRFDRTPGELPRGRWLAEVAFLIAAMDVGIAGMFAVVVYLR